MPNLSVQLPPSASQLLHMTNGFLFRLLFLKHCQGICQSSLLPLYFLSLPLRRRKPDLNPAELGDGERDGKQGIDSGPVSEG